MGEQLEYICHECRGKFTGMALGYFVTGAVDGVFCSLYCLFCWVEGHQVRLNEAHEHEVGGSG